MEYQRIGNKIIVRLDKGDKVVEQLTLIAKKEKIKTGTISGIGAVDFAQLNFYILKQQNYKTVDFNEEFEVLSLLGNFTLNEDEPNIHLHITLGRSDYSTIGGHLKEASVSITLEIFIDVIDSEIIRQDNPELNNFKHMAFNQ